MSVCRCSEPGWIEIGKRCSADRRSLWARLNFKSPPHPATNENIESIELCAGREGDDAYAIIHSDNPSFAALLEVILTAQYAATT